MNKYSSLKLSKALKEAGFEGESEYRWDVTDEGLYTVKSGFVISHWVTAYDLLWDLCIRYAGAPT